MIEVNSIRSCFLLESRIVIRGAFSIVIAVVVRETESRVFRGTESIPPVAVLPHERRLADIVVSIDGGDLNILEIGWRKVPIAFETQTISAIQVRRGTKNSPRIP